MIEEYKSEDRMNFLRKVHTFFSELHPLSVLGAFIVCFVVLASIYFIVSGSPPKESSVDIEYTRNEQLKIMLNTTLFQQVCYVEKDVFLAKFKSNVTHEINEESVGGRWALVYPKFNIYKNMITMDTLTENHVKTVSISSVENLKCASVPDELPQPDANRPQNATQE